MAADREIARVLEELGFAGPEAQQSARTALEAAGLTRPGKTRISNEKFARARELLDAAFVRSCSDGNCRTALAASRPGRQLLRVLDARQCQHCGGSDNRRAMLRFAEACRASRVRRVVIVGGSPNVRAELQALVPPDLELRLIDGTERRTLDKARADLDWAHLVLIWGASELDHRVSKLYTGPANRKKVVAVARRGLAALLSAGVEHLERVADR